MSSSSSTTTGPKGTGPEWTVIYHLNRSVKGRGEFLQLMLEDAGITDYEYKSDVIYGPTGMMDMFRGDAVDGVDTHYKLDGKAVFPMLYPPAILHRPTNGTDDDVVIVNQVGACMIYLGDVLGYAPGSVGEKARANAIMLNSLDYISEGRRSFHPVQDKMSYNDQKEEADKSSKEWSQTRMQMYLRHFNKVVEYTAQIQRDEEEDKDNDDKCYMKPIAGGRGVTYADFALFHVLHATEVQFNTQHYDMAWDNCNAIGPLKTYYNWFKTSRPNLVAFLNSDRSAPFSGNSMM
jgi:Glutathione S-transferase, C-terminal domain